MEGSNIYRAIETLVGDILATQRQICAWKRNHKCPNIRWAQIDFSKIGEVLTRLNEIQSEIQGLADEEEKEKASQG